MAGNVIPFYRVWHQRCWSAPADERYPVVEITGTYGAAVKALLRECQTPGLVLVEHDIASDDEADRRFIASVLEHPNEVRVRPYYCYPRSTNFPVQTIPHLHAIKKTWVVATDLPCPVGRWGTGYVYLPAALHEIVDERWDYPLFDTHLSVRAGRAWCTTEFVEHLHR